MYEQAEVFRRPPLVGVTFEREITQHYRSTRLGRGDMWSLSLCEGQRANLAASRASLACVRFTLLRSDFAKLASAASLMDVETTPVTPEGVTNFTTSFLPDLSTSMTRS